MHKAERQKFIVETVDQRGFIPLKELQKLLNVSMITLRRDASELAELGLIEKTYGGLKSKKSESESEKKFNERRKHNLQRKKRIAELALDYVQSGDTLFLDGSTTVYQFAQLLAFSSLNLYVITTSVMTALELSKNPRIEIILIGGLLRHGFFTLVGPIAEENLKKFGVGKFFFSCRGFIPSDGTYEANMLEAQSKKSMLSNSDKHILLADFTKIGSRSIIKCIDIGKIDILITDQALEPKDLKILEKNSVKVIN